MIFIIVIAVNFAALLHTGVTKDDINSVKTLYSKGNYSLALEKIMLLLKDDPGNKELRILLNKTWDAISGRKISGRKEKSGNKKESFITEKDKIALIKKYKKKQYLYFLRYIKDFSEEEIKENKKIWKILNKIKKKMLKYFEKEKPEVWYIYSKAWLDYKDGKIKEMRKNLNKLYKVLKKSKEKKNEIDFSEIEFFVKNIKKHLKTGESETLIQKGNIFYKKGQYNKAISFWRKAMGVIGDTDKDRKKKILKKIEIAREKLLEIRIREDIETGVQYYQQGDVASAIKIWMSLYNSIKDKPRYSEVKSILTEYINRAQAEYGKLKEINQKKAKELYDKGLVEYYKGNLDKAIEYWENAYRLNPESKEIKDALSKAKLMREKRKEFQNK